MTLQIKDRTFNTKYDPFRPFKNDCFTDITVILDRSGSMESVRKATISGFNEFVNSQKMCGGDAEISLVQFDNQYETVYKSLPIGSVPKLTNKTFQPRGMTALNDAIGLTINGIKNRLAESFIKPDQVIVVIITDGIENASREYTQSSVARMIKGCKNNDWKFIFLGANQDAIVTGAQYNIGRGQSMSYMSSGRGTVNAFNATSNVVSNLRGGVQDASFTGSMRKEAMEKDADA